MSWDSDALRKPSHVSYINVTNNLLTKVTRTIWTQRKSFSTADSPPTKDNTVSRDSANFFVSEKINLEKTKARIFFSLRGQDFTPQTVTLDFDSASLNVLVLFGQLASWTIFGVDTKTVDIEVSDEANCW